MSHSVSQEELFVTHMCLLTHGETVLGGVLPSAHIDVPMLPPVMSEIKPSAPFNVRPGSVRLGNNTVALPARLVTSA